MALNINGTTGISGVDGSASAPALQGTDSNTGINFGSDTVNINTGGVTRATVDSSGNVGIGTTSPEDSLHIKSGKLRIENAIVSNNDSTISYDNQDFIIDVDPNNVRGSSTFQVKIDAVAGLTIDDNRRVGIGTTSPSAKIHADNGGSGNVAFLKHASSGIAVTLVLQNNRATGSLAGEQISFLDDSGTQRGKITNTTSSTTYATSSDYRLKENEVLISDGIERVKQLKPYKFNWKHIPNKTVDGFFAHEVENLVEDCVDGIKDKVVTQEDHNKGDYTDKEIGTEIHQMMDHSKLVPLLTAALQEAVAKIEVLETKVAALEAG